LCTEQLVKSAKADRITAISDTDPVFVAKSRNSSVEYIGRVRERHVGLYQESRA
jgi:hypothetical protein